MLPVQSLGSESQGPHCQSQGRDSYSPAGADVTTEPLPQSWKDLDQPRHSVGLGLGWVTIGMPQRSRLGQRLFFLGRHRSLRVCTEVSQCWPSVGTVQRG